jgi:hypothetical protein
MVQASQHSGDVLGLHLFFLLGHPGGSHQLQDFSHLWRSDCLAYLDYSWKMRFFYPVALHKAIQAGIAWNRDSEVAFFAVRNDRHELAVVFFHFLIGIQDHGEMQPSGIPALRVVVKRRQDYSTMTEFLYIVVA